MHDGGGDRGDTLAALPRIIDTLRARGYRFETVSELLGERLALPALRLRRRRGAVGREGLASPAPRPARPAVDPRRPDRAGRRRAPPRLRPAVADLRATVTIHDPAAWRAPLRGSVGLGEAYVDGLWETDDLVALMRIAARELRHLDGLRGAVATSPRPAHRLRGLVPDNTRERARRHISAHYDLGNDLFAAFLDERMMYSCAYFPRADTSLEEAQLAKLERICGRLRLGPDNHLLEIGSGWGGLAIHAAREHGCRVTTTTISREQHELAEQAGPRGRPRGPGHRPASRTTATSAAATTGWSRSR